MINTEIETLRKELAELINSKLKAGIPISVVKLIAENILMELDNGLKTTLEQEAAKIQEQQLAESEQVEWVDPEPVETECDTNGD